MDYLAIKNFSNFDGGGIEVPEGNHWYVVRTENAFYTVQHI
jgi:hypothetical protein